MSILRSSITSLVLLTAMAMPVHAAITTIGDVDPCCAPTYPSYWVVEDQWNNMLNLYVGYYGEGTLKVGWGQVNDSAGYIGYTSSSTGTATITGSWSLWNNSGHLYVGSSGTGTLNVEAGGEVSNTGGYIGRYSGATGVATVTGFGSLWNNSYELSVGSEGKGTLNVLTGGEVSNTSGYIGHQSGSTGVVTVTGVDSQWNNSYTLSVGRYGSGTLNVTDGGVVSNTGGYIGQESGSTGMATVTGSGSHWSNSVNLYVGDQGDGTLNVTDGGVVNVGTEMFLSLLDFSQWNNSEDPWIGGNSGTLYVGSSGTGTLKVTDGGVVNVAGSATIGAQGNLILNAGTLDVAHTLTIEHGGTATVNGAMLEVGGLVGAGNLIFIDSGTYGLGSVTNSEGIGLTGTLGVGQANLSLIDADGVDLGSSTTLAGGTLGSLTGFELDSGDAISGHGRLFGDLALGTNGTVTGKSTGLELFGHVSGSGWISDTTIYGNIDVGNSVGQLTLTDVVLGSDNTVVTLEIGGADSSLYDTITLAGDTTLAGSLEVELIDSFLPQAGDTFDIFDLASANLSGTFSAVNLPSLTSGLTWENSDLLTAGQLRVLGMLLGGDANGDGVIDVADLGVLGANFNQSNMAFADGDFNDDGIVDVADLGILGANWNASQTTGNSSALVPEPTTLSLLAVSVLLVSRRRR